jgi:hypothetical protein
MAAHVLAADIPNSIYLLAGMPERPQPQPVASADNSHVTAARGSGPAARAGSLRDFDRQLEAIEAEVIGLFATVYEDLPGVTAALLNGHNEAAGQLAEREQAINALYGEIEQAVSRAILLWAPVASDLRFLLSVLRIVPELERSHDLVCHIASRAGHVPGAGL